MRNSQFFWSNFMYNRDSEIDMENVAAFLKDAYDKVLNQEDPDVLTAIKKTFKKTVPLSKRMYVAAYLAKEMQKGFRGNFRSRRDFRENKRNFNSERPARERRPVADAVRTEEKERTPRPRVAIDPSQAAVIFISIGKNRRVYPRDLVGLLISVAGIDRDRIGDIRVLANYSFVQLFAEDAEKAINVINGYDYRGRKLAVSYSRQKDEAGNDGLAGSFEDDQSAEDAAAYAAATKASGNEAFGAPHVEPTEAPAEDNGDMLV